MEAVYKSIRKTCEAGVGVLLISSELDELIAVAHRISGSVASRHPDEGMVNARQDQ